MHKILNTAGLRSRLKSLRKEHKKIVFTNGCFDLLHSGHIKIFKISKSLGDVLIVGLNTDASIKRLKGAKRPILNLKERLAVLSAVSYIDFLVPFKEDTPARLIKQIKPDVLVKGGDYKKGEIVGRNDSSKVVRVGLLKGSSTTSIIERIIKNYAK